MATSEAIEAAGRSGADLLLGHESLYYPYDAAVRGDNPDGWELWEANSRRRRLLEKHRLTFLRVHGSMDEICILTEFAELLGLGAPVYEEGLVRVYEIEECSYGELIERVKARTGMGRLRCSFAADAGRRVRRVGLPWGGLGLYTNVGYQQRVLERGVDVMIAGETDNYGFRFAAEWDVPLIETSHETSENPGVRRFSEMLAREFPDVQVRFHENERVWDWR
jgi:putative NIF3 family GTP cyclohydrolase 1 type 2